MVLPLLLVTNKRDAVRVLAALPALANSVHVAVIVMIAVPLIRAVPVHMPGEAIMAILLIILW